MTKLIFLRGLIGSGKTTWALEQVKNSKGKIKRVNKDDLRSMIDAGVWSKKNEQQILDVQNSMALGFLLNGFDVILDNTNFASKHETYWREMSKKYGFDFEIKFFDTPLEECIKRDSLRPNPVGRNIIMQMYNQYLKPEPPKYNPDLPDCILVDLDGNLSLFTGNPYDRDFENDVCNEPVRSIMQKFSVDHEILIVSGRSSKHKDITIKWLDSNLVPFNNIYMRDITDNRSDSIVKSEFLAEIIKKYNVKFVIDDRKKVKRMWVSNGIFVFDTNQLDLEF